MSRRPFLPGAQQAIKEYQRPSMLKTSFQADFRSTKGEKKDIVLMISMMSPRREGLRSLHISGVPVCAFGLCASLAFIPVVSKRECISSFLRQATPKGEDEHSPQKRNIQPLSIIGTSHLSVSFGSN